jgi:hypothetical protein
MQASFWDWFVSALWLILVVIALNELRAPPQERVIIGSGRAKISILLFTVAVLVGWLDVFLGRSRGVTNLVLLPVATVLTVTAIAIFPWRARKPAQR